MRSFRKLLFGLFYERKEVMPFIGHQFCNSLKRIVTVLKLQMQLMALFAKPI